VNAKTNFAKPERLVVAQGRKKLPTPLIFRLEGAVPGAAASRGFVASLSPRRVRGSQHLDERIVREARVAARRLHVLVAEKPLEVPLGNAPRDRVVGDAVFRAFVE
jgi:hypothetical protein